MPSAPDETGPIPTSGIWDERRRALQRVLEKQDSVCAELYGRAVDALGEEPLRSGALVIASHCLRELVNRLGRLLGDSMTGRGLGLTRAVEGMATVWARHGGSLAHASETGEAAGQGELFELIGAIGKVLDAFNAGRASVRTLRSVLAVGNPTELDNPTVRTFKQSTDAFERFRHPQGSTEGWPKDAGPLLPPLRVIEDAIEGRIGSFFEVAHDVRALLARANKRGPNEEWAAPSDVMFDRVISRIGDLQHRRVFFMELQNPLWILRLLDAGALDPPGVPLDDARGWAPWPAGPYLVRVAGDRPRDVASALEQILRRPGSREVHDSAVKAAAQMPANIVAGLVPILKTIPVTPLDPAIGLGIADLVEVLGRGGHERGAIKLGSALLRPRISQNDGGRPTVGAGIEVYWYSQALQRLSAGLADSPKLLPTLVAWLELALAANGVDPTASYDYGYIARPAIGRNNRRHGRDDITQSLTDVLRDAAVASMRTTSDPAKVLAVLERGHYPLLGRIARYALAETVLDNPTLVDHAFDLLLDRGPLDGQTTPREYLDLARHTLPLLDDLRYRQWETLILGGPQETHGRRDRIREHLQPGETEEGVWAEYADRWLLDILGTVGAPALRGDALARLAGLRERLGDPHDPSPGDIAFVESSSLSDSDADTLRGLSVREVIEFATAWTPPTPDRWGTASYDVGHAFSAVVQERPVEFCGQAREVIQLPGLFVGRFFDGLRSAIDSGSSLDWPPLLDALPDLPESSASAAIDAEADHDERPAYALRTAIYVLQAAVGKPTSGFTNDYVDQALEFTLRYLHDPEPQPDAPTTVDEIERDPVNIALNSVQPVAVATCVRLAHFAKANNAPTTSSVTDRVTAGLTGLLEPERVGSSPVAAALGSSLGQLFWLAPDWVETHAGRLLGADWYGDIVATVALLYYSRPASFFPVMSGKLAELISRVRDGEDLNWAWTHHVSIIELLGESMMRMVLTGERDLSDNLVAQYLLEVPPRTRGEVLFRVGNLLGQEDNIPADILDRARGLWDARAEATRQNPVALPELSGFYVWVDSGKFSVDWWLPRLREVALTTDLEGVTYLGEHLVEAAPHDPGGALDVLDTLIRGISEPWARYDLVDHAPHVIAHALDCGDKAIAEKARNLTDYLGRQGYLQISDLVGQAQSSLQTP